MERGKKVKCGVRGPDRDTILQMPTKVYERWLLDEEALEDYVRGGPDEDRHIWLLDGERNVLIELKQGYRSTDHWSDRVGETIGKVIEKLKAEGKRPRFALIINDPPGMDGCQGLYVIA